MIYHLKLTLFCALILNAASAHAAIINGSFEEPVVPAGGFTVFVPGGSTNIPGWTVLGAEVAIGDTAFSQSGITFQAQDGQQWLDLSGFANPTIANGVTQEVTTTIGTSYALSFYVGSATDGFLFFPSTVDLSIDGGSRISFTNPTAPNDMLDWHQFTHVFTAQNATTTITFFDGDSANFLSGLDNVTLTAVPEPLTLLGAGTAVGFGAFFKQELNKKKKQKDSESA